MKYLLSICLVFVAACASNEEKTEPKKYSEDTNRAFEMIERGGSYYLKKAPENSVRVPQVKAPQKKATPEKKKTEPLAVKEVVVIDEKINYEEEKLAPAELAPNPHVKRNTSRTDERLIEINQNLAFYCMKNRNDPRFGGDEKKCMTFVNRTMTGCQKVHRIVNSKLLNCIQTKLRKK